MPPNDFDHVVALQKLEAAGASFEWMPGDVEEYVHVCGSGHPRCQNYGKTLERLTEQGRRRVRQLVESMEKKTRRQHR